MVGTHTAAIGKTLVYRILPYGKVIAFGLIGFVALSIVGKSGKHGLKVIPRKFAFITMQLVGSQ